MILSASLLYSFYIYRSKNDLALFFDQKLLKGISPYVALARSQSELTTLFSPVAKKFLQLVGRRS